MTRRELLHTIGLSVATQALAAPSDSGLPNTQPLDWNGDLSERMMDGAHRFVERKIAESLAGRPKYWNRGHSVEPNRARFLKMIGLVDERVPVAMERFGDDDDNALVAETAAYRIYQVRWPVLEGVWGEGLLLEPVLPASGFVIAVPDADQQPEQLQFAHRLAAAGCEVIVPVLLDRTARWSGHPDIHITDQTHREWIYRQAFHMGRHVIGYEVQKVLAAVDWFRRRNPVTKIGAAGYGEGGLIAFYAAAADARIDAALVSGYFDN